MANISHTSSQLDSNWPPRDPSTRVPNEKFIVEGAVVTEELHEPIIFNQHKVDVVSHLPETQNRPLPIKSALKGSSHAFEFTPQDNINILNQQGKRSPSSVSDTDEFSNEDDSKTIKNFTLKEESGSAVLPAAKESPRAEKQLPGPDLNKSNKQVLDAAKQTSHSLATDFNQPLVQQDEKKAAKNLQEPAFPSMEYHDYDTEEGNTDMAPSYARHPIGADGKRDTSITLDMHGAVMGDTRKKGPDNSCAIS